MTLKSDAPPEVIQWIRKHAVPFKTVEAGSGFADLGPLRQMIGDARIVALGEATHGSREISQMNHRLIEFLVREVGDDVYVLACKKEGPTLHVRFSGLPAECKTGRVMFEEPRKVEAADGGFTDWFGPFDVHVYKFSK